MEKIVFLDRDGVINNPNSHYYVHRVKDFVFNTGLVEGLQDLRDRGYKFIVITNQGGISKGEFSIEDVNQVHEHMLSELQKHKIEIMDVYICPHHDTLENCLCRKPKPLMIEKAIARYKVDRKRSYFIGDKQSDIDAGEAAGITSIKIEKNQDIRDILHKIID